MIKAVIFDMDGVIVDSEPFWQQAEKEVFTALGVKVTDKLSKQTQWMTTAEVAHFWYNQQPWQGVSLKQTEEQVVDRVIELIQSHDCLMPGVQQTVKRLKAMGIKIGLATNSPYRIIPEVLRKAKLASSFDALCSAEFEVQGKPQPDVYFSALSKLEVTAEQALAIEDSNSGIKAARRAGMNVVGLNTRKLSGALYQVSSFHELDLNNLLGTD